MAIITNTEDIEEVYMEPKLRALPKVVLGGGSNILFTGNQRKVFLKVEIEGIEVVEESEEEVVIKVGAGVIWHQLVLWCIENGYGGIENLSLIPGTVGAAPIQNIGAYGVELKDVFVSLEAIIGKTGERRTFDKAECQFGYRYSVFKGSEKGKYIVTSVKLRLSKNPEFNVSYGNLEATLRHMGVEELSLESVSQAVINVRQSKLPDPSEIGNAGSFFKNPVVEKPLVEALQSIYESMPVYAVNAEWNKIPAAWFD